MELLQYVLDLFLHLDVHLEKLIANWGPAIYGLLFFIIFAETGLVVLPFLPGDSLLFAAGAFAARGDLSFSLLCVLLIGAAVLGDTVNYSIGQYFGKRLLAMKRFKLIRQEHLDKTKEVFERYGAYAIIVARFIPIVRTFAPFVAGMGAMTYSRFMTYNIVGAFVWVLVCTGAGYLLGSWKPAKENFEVVVLVIIGISVLPIIFEVVRSRWRAKSEPPASQPPS